MSTSPTNSTVQSQTWRYEPDQVPKKKHAWNQDFPGFDKQGEYLVGKCPSGFDLALAEARLNDGIPEWGESEHPKKIWIVHEGVLYRATPTVPGRSYHAFPELADKFEDLPGSLKKSIWERANQLNCAEKLKQWFKKAKRPSTQ